MKKAIQLIFDPEKKLDRVQFMNTIASVVQILHTDKSVGTIEIQIAKAGKISKTYAIKLK